MVATSKTTISSSRLARSIHGVIRRSALLGLLTVSTLAPSYGAVEINTLHTLTAREGSTPSGVVLTSDGVLAGGVGLATGALLGSVFNVLPSDGSFSTEYKFRGPSFPQGALVEAVPGTLFGVTTTPAAVFALDSLGSASFIKIPAGALSSPSSAGVSVGPDGKLYGATLLGGTNLVGTIFQVDTGLTTISTVHSFVGATEGGAPLGVISGPGGLLYGVTSLGGANGGGTIFSMSPDGTTFKVLHTFDKLAANNGFIPSSTLTLGSDGRLYGVTRGIILSSTPATVFSINPDGSDFVVLHRFNASTEGFNPDSPLIERADGTLYGTTAFDGTGGRGALFGITKAAAGGQFQVLYTFSGASSGLGQGSVPSGPIALDANGSLYGTTSGLLLKRPTVYKADITRLTVTLTSSVDQPQPGQHVDLKAVIAKEEGAPVDGGSVTFYANGVVINTVPVVDSAATLTTSFSSGGNHNVIAVYSGVAYDASTSEVDGSDVFNFDALPPVASTTLNVFVPGATPPTPDYGHYYFPVNPVITVPAGTSVVVNVMRTSTLGDAGIHFATVNGTAIEGRDFTAIAGDLTFEDGTDTRPITITLLPGALAGRTFQVQLSAPTGKTALVTTTLVTVQIGGTVSPYLPYIDAAFSQANAQWTAGDYGASYNSLANYYYYLYLMDAAASPTPSRANLNQYYQNLAYAYYFNYTKEGDPAAALAWYNYLTSFIS